MTVTSYGCRGRRAPGGQVDEQGGLGPCPVQAGAPGGPTRRPQRPCPLPDVAGGGGRAWQHMQVGVHGLGGRRSRSSSARDPDLHLQPSSAAGCSNLG